MNSKSLTQLGRLAIFATSLFGGMLSLTADTSVASGIFDYPGVPAHSGHISWSAPEAIGGPPHFHQHHLHKTMHQVTPPDALPGHDVAHELSGTRTNEPDYDPYSVWVNETYMVFDGSAGGAKQEFFSHGFIIESNQPTPEFRFVGDAATFSLFGADGMTAFDPRPFVRDGFKTWSDINVDDPHLRMGLAFREFADDGDAAEIAVSFVDFISGAVAEWTPGAKTLKFRRYADALKTKPMKWFTGAVGDFPGRASDRDDLIDVALHEIGHIVGLDHTPYTDDIMTAGTHPNLRVLSGDDILGARDLYSIPVPEPSALVLFGMACLGMSWSSGRRRPRNARN